MTTVKCSKGHTYDKALGYCPVCQRANEEWTSFNGGDVPPTSPSDIFSHSEPFSNPGATVPVSDPGFFSPSNMAGGTVDSFGATTPQPINEVKDFRPVVGWLMCVKGPNRGSDYRLFNGNNFLGSDPSNDICVSGDTTISRERAAVIAYDDKSKTFFLKEGGSHNLIYLNDSSVNVAEKMTRYDRIAVGSTEFVFVPLCGESFSWQEY